MREPVWVRREVLLALHQTLLARYGGADGIRSEELLESALSRPMHLHSYGTPDIFALAAAYLVGIVKNHPFVDGNKRVAFMAAYIFLVRNGHQLKVSEADVVATMGQAAAGQTSERDLASWLARHSEAMR